MIVSINGVMLIPGIDYTTTDKSVAFATPPQVMASVEIRTRSDILAKFCGDGYTYRFDFMNIVEDNTSYMLDDAFKLRHVPAVADALERLQVVVELTKQNDTLHKR